MQMSKGISLIVLVITIIVIIILAGSVILSLSTNNPIVQANEAKFKTNVAEYNSELALFISGKYLLNSSFDTSSFNASIWNGISSTTGTIKEYITSITASDAAKFEIQNSKLVYVGDIQVEKDYITSMGLLNKIELGVTVIASVNSTVNGRAPSYNNPIIPKGFRAINTTTIWPTDWNTGLVIEDASANQFVWVPVDGTDVKYIKWCVVGQVYNDARITDDTLPIGITNESNQITKYGGFYIARYEAGKVSTSTLVSKKDAIVWNSTDYTDAKTVSELMYNTAEVKSHLITGTQWDTTMEWIKDSGKNVTDSTTWGNYSNSTFPANVSGFGNKQVAGYSENWKANNIYDLAGGMVEWTNENFGSDRVIRGGDFPQTGNYAPASSRDYQQPSYAPYFIYQNYSFRVSLYIL